MFIKETELQNRIFGLDLLRCIAIVFVLIAHTSTFLTNEISNNWTLLGFFGVEFFFVLSGYLIGTILIKVHNNQEHTSLSNVKVFWIRRWFRTLPNFYLMLAVYTLIFYLLKHRPFITDLNYWKYVVFLQNSFSPQPDFFNISWSLSVEEWFYLLFPMALLLFQWLTPNKKRSFLATIVLFITICLGARIMLNASNYKLEWDGWFRKLMPLRLDSIAFGVLAAFIKIYHEEFWFKYKKFFALLSCLLISLILIYLLNYPKDVITTTFGRTFLFTLISFTISLLLPILLTLKTPSKYIQYPITIISLISYSVYLTHPLVIGVVDKLGMKNLAGVVVLWLGTLIISYFQYTLFESRITHLRERLNGKNNVIKVTN
jgi:peptidoglycan/LPS O-acetylase OafA/YrhL